MNHKKVILSIIFLLFFTVGCSMGMFSPTIDIDNENITTLKASDGEITIITPENRTYTEPDSGYYPATFGFESDIEGIYPEGFTNSHNLGNTTVIDTKKGHHKVAQLEDIEVGSAGWPELLQYFEQTQQSGTLEFYLLSEDVNKYVDIMIEDGRAVWGVHLNIYNGELRYYTTSWNTILGGLQNDTWYHFKIDFECGSGNYMGLTQDKFYVSLNGVRYGSYSFRATRTQMNLFRVVGYINDPFKFYVDAIGYSWDSFYSIGDNLNEGLYLSYYNTTNLDWKAYSLDGAANRTILGNTTITLPSDGLHSIQLYGNTMGTMYESTARSFSVDTTAPEISIDYPLATQEFSDPPAYILSINETNIDALWYTLNGGIEIPFTGNTGTISTAVWNALPNGPVTIRFTVRDIALREAFDEIIVVKISSGGTTPPTSIPGYEIYFLLGALSISSILLIKKRLNSR